MPQSPQPLLESDFSGGYKTDFTGLNFPANAVFATDNVVYPLTKSSERRGGFNYEANFTLNNIGVAAAAKSTYHWKNAGGDGATEMVVQQIGSTLYFYKSSSSTVASPLSAQIQASTVSISTFLVSGSSADPSQFECTYASGNGYLFVYNPVCEPFYVSYDGISTFTATAINVQIRDFAGITETTAFNFRPTSLSTQHLYNLQNQGWVSADWTGSGVSAPVIIASSGTFTFTVVSSNFATIPAFIGETVVATSASGSGSITGTVVSYSVGSTSAVLVITATASTGTGNVGFSWTFQGFATSANAQDLIGIWNNGGANPSRALNNYPSNADVWWAYRDTHVTNNAPSGKFRPDLTVNYVVLSNVRAPNGYYTYSAFNINRSANVSGTTDISTTARPTNGTWFQGRVWFTGISSSFQATGDAAFTTWTENIYFSQIATDPSQFGRCFQENDPTNDKLFDLLATDGGVITIQGTGTIYRLVPVQNGLLVFAANGVWFITGSQGIGFSANDYTVTKISGVKCISSTSFVDVNGWPMFWNEEGVYTVTPSQQGGGLVVDNLCVGNISSYFDAIPSVSKRYTRGAYDSINFIVQWVYRNTAESSVTTRYQYDRILCYNAATKAFYTYSFSGTTRIHDVLYVSYPGGTSTPNPSLKYPVSSSTNVTFAEESDFTTFTDFASGTPVDFVSTFTTGYKLAGKGITRFQVPYVIFYNDDNTYKYSVQGVWNYANTGSGTSKFTQTQIVQGSDTKYDRLYNRLRVRGRGNVLQLKVSSFSGHPFSIMGWAVWDTVNQQI